MNILESFAKYLEVKTTFSSLFIYCIIQSIVAFIIIKITKKFFKALCSHFDKDQRKKYLHNQKYNIFLDIILIITWYVIWSAYLTSLVTVISFVSAALTLALRDVVYNFFAGMYISIKKPFSVEDRIEVKDIIGDVVNTNYLSFEVLEVNNKDKGEQSTGRIVSFPNSYVFSEPIKNYVKEFKYIWNEMTIKIDIDSDIKKTKHYLYKIVNENEIVSSIPRKMENQIGNVDIDYRIYYNKLKPIIYTSIVDNHVELVIRFLCHPKKIRIVENEIWLQILDYYKKGKINLFKD